MSHAGALRSVSPSRAAQFVGNNHARSTPTYTQPLAEESHGCESVALGLDKNINDGAFLIDCTP
jgi:hypothetical protein